MLSEVLIADRQTVRNWKEDADTELLSALLTVQNTAMSMWLLMIQM